MKSKIIPPLFIILFSVLGMKAFLHPGLFTAHDIWHQVVRLYYYFQAVNDGQFPPYWIGQLANNFGYPLFLFSYQLPWIIGTVFMKTGLDIATAIKTLFFLSYLASGITMYFFVNNLLKNRLSALLSGILYLWLPYHFLIIFVGASMGIAFVFTFLPLVLLGIHLLKEERIIGIAVLSAGLSGIILSHIMHLVFLFPLILIFFFWEFISSSKKGIFLKNITFGLILTILLSSFYLIPAVYYNQFTRVHQETGFSELYKRNFINLNQLIYSKWGYGPIVNNAKNGESSFQLGLAQWISIIILVLLIVSRKLSRFYRNLGISILIIFATNVFLMLDYSKPIWNLLIKFTTVDFPFRLLLPTAFIASVSAGIVLVNIKKSLRTFVFILLILVTIYTNRNHINVNQYTNFPISTYLNIETEKTTNTYNEYLPIKANGKLLDKPWDEIVGENISSSKMQQTTNLLSFNLNVTKEGTVSAGQFFFPGQNLYIDNRQIKFTADKEGRINFIISPGIHKIAVKYQETLLIAISKVLTIIGILIILIIFLKNLKLFRKDITSN
ncbi:hypothetical protein A3I48_00360 [Candidatus Daviesbacteria bacterium RIFCSPLOWO2_02_FULL_36_7]|uniref:Membrane protein 6-pyruvoyl-tetrahydropterin synthase-related domain-containing protein n=1 Tax=Candidatus Daviesbacteria bacterium RIFCSPLOWO2_02_FULL_36_7 TaxID=1797792 RepID=A0A1F5MHJ1_9BACT|nr:MAG: hypothetical protein A3I48_00360 [Candidatus Daviesbacteria bacterium RIFCSPLOWO2_02_FULL_36_7]